MQHPIPPARTARALGAALVLLVAPAAAQEPSPAPAPPGPSDQDDQPPLPFLDLPLADAVSRSEREQKLLLVFWSSESFPDCARMRAGTFRDAQLGDWIRRNAIAVEVDGPKDVAAAAAYKISVYPCVDLYDPLLGLGVERLPGYQSADDLLASFSGALVGGAAAPKPDGAALEDPYAWLAYANGQWRLAEGAAEAARAYAWALSHGESFRPGFRSRYFEFLCRRLAYLKPRSREALIALQVARSEVEGRLLGGYVDERAVYELVRLDWWLRKEHQTRETFLTLAGRGEAAERARALLFRHVLDDLGRHRQTDEILALIGEANAAATIAARFDRIDANLERQAAGVALKDEELDGKNEAVLGATWIYDALLAAGRGRDADEVVELIAARAPTGRAFALLVERAWRRGLYEVALRVGARGLPLVEGQQGERQLRRALEKVPGYAPGDGDAPVGPADDDRTTVAPPDGQPSRRE